MTGLRVVLADDDVLLRESLASLLQQSGFEVVGRAVTGRGYWSRSASSRRTSWWPISGCRPLTPPRDCRRPG